MNDQTKSEKKPRQWTLTAGVVRSNKRNVKVVIAVGPIPDDLERILVEEKENKYVERNSF